MKLPKGSIMMSNLLVVEYMTAEGDIFTEVEHYDSAGDELELAKQLELTEFAKAKALVPLTAQLVGEYVLAADG